MTEKETQQHNDLAESLAVLLYPHGDWPEARQSFLRNRLETLETAVLVARISGSDSLALTKAMRQVLQGLAEVTRLQIAAAKASPSADHDGQQP